MLPAKIRGAIPGWLLPIFASIFILLAGSGIWFYEHEKERDLTAEADQLARILHK